MKTPKKPRMSPEQTTYTAARALHETLLAERDRRFAAEGLRLSQYMDDEDAERIFLAQEIIETAIGLKASRLAMRAAEEALVTWGVAHACRFSPAHAELLRSAEERARRSAIHWPKLVDICFRLGGEGDLYQRTIDRSDGTVTYARRVARRS